MIYKDTEEKWVQLCTLDANNEICFTPEYVELMKDIGNTREFACRLITWWGVPDVQRLLNYFGPEDEDVDKYDGIDTHPMDLAPDQCDVWDYQDLAQPGLDADWYRDLLRAKLVSIKIPERLIKSYVKAAKKSTKDV